MRSSKKYQEIADILHKIAVEEREAGRPLTERNICFCELVDVFIEEFEKTNPRFKKSFFMREVLK